MGIAMHPEAERKLSKRFEITNSTEELHRAEAAIVYVIPEEWTGDDTLHLRTVGCHACSDAFSAWAANRGIQITIAHGLRRTVAEHTLALAMAAARSVPQSDQDVRNGNWHDHCTLKIKHSGIDFQGKSFGILGMGRIGQELAKLLCGFQVRILYHDTKPLDADQERELGVESRSFESLLAESDFLSVLVPLNDRNRGLLDRRAFARMKPGCVFINTARAGICVYEDFVDAMKKGVIGAAALDVLWEEATNQPDELVGFDNLIMTPHLGGSTYECDMTLVDGVSRSFS